MPSFGRKSKICPACGHPATTTDPLVKTTQGWTVHRSHTTDPRSGFYGTAKR